IEQPRIPQNPGWQNRGWQRQDRGIPVQQQRPEIFDRERARQIWRDPQDNGITNNPWRDRDRSEAPLANAVGRIPPGLIRSQEVHERNAERQAWRQGQRAWNYGGYAGYNWDSGYRGDYYGDRRDRWEDRRREFWRDNSLRNVIVNVLSGYS